MCLSLQGYGQQCEGSLGDNIFVRGSFGSGMDNIPSQDPNIAPGYQYTRTGPPSDGLYTITNNTGAWENLYQTWIRIGDNSPDPNGYMMVVNADFSPGVFYSEVVSDLCENTLYEFSADIINVVGRTVPNHILPSVDFILDGVALFSTGSIPQNEQWNRYGFTFRTPPGTTEMTLELRNNAPGGIGNDLALDNISFRACGPNAFIEYDATETIFLCENDNRDITFTADLGNSGYEIQWQLSRDRGASWEDLLQSNNVGIIHSDFRPGTYRYRYLAAPNIANLQNFKCRTISDELEIEVLPIRHDITDTICEGETYPLGSDLITSPGTHTANLISSRNCDSIVTLTLHHVQDPGIGIDFEKVDPRCVGDTSGQVIPLLASGSVAPYTYLLDDLVVDPEVANPLPAGQYLLRVLDRYRCSAEVTIALLDPEPFRIDVGPDTTLRLGQPIIRAAQANFPIQTIEWSPPLYIDCADCEQVQIVGIENIAYMIQAISEEGCQSNDTLRIEVDRTLRVFAPNAFSPNGDGSNDFFMLAASGLAVREIESLQIFDRWGSLVFQEENIPLGAEQRGWDGQIAGQPAGIDTYLYTATLRLLDDSVEVRSGTVLLVR